METLTNSTKLSEFESTLLENINIAIWVIAGIAICVALSCIKNLCESIAYTFKCIYYVLCCRCCFPKKYRRQYDDDY
jgi:hypothetical protein